MFSRSIKRGLLVLSCFSGMAFAGGDPTPEPECKSHVPKQVSVHDPDHIETSCAICYGNGCTPGNGKTIMMFKFAERWHKYLCYRTANVSAGLRSYSEQAD